MSHFRHHSFVVISLFCSVFCLFSLVGCGTKDTPTPNQDELVTLYTPRDDGKPLTPAELKAFNAKGELDRKLEHADKQIVEKHFKFFVHEKRQTFERFLTRSARYLPYAKKVFKDRGLPEEMAYLFMIESGGNPNAVSPAKAAGLWQFIPSTGKVYGLAQDKWIDERRDPYKSTFAASDYLLKLYGDFKSWHLAAAAYNAGEGKIGRALGGTGADDFFELCRIDRVLDEGARLRNETREYVPRLIAVAKIMRNLRLLGFTEPSPAMALNLTPVSVPPNIDLKAFSQVLGMSWETFAEQNPAYRRSVSPPGNSSTAYVAPGQLVVAQNWLSSGQGRVVAEKKSKKTAAQSKSAGPGFYLVEKGDTLYGIARQHSMSVGDLCTLNDMKPQANIKTGQRLRVNKKAPAGKQTAPLAAQAAKGSDNVGQKAGKPASSADNSVGKTAAKQSQSGKAPVSAAPGQKKAGTETPSSKTASLAGAPTGGSIVVQAGDTLYSLARKHNVSVDALRKRNKLTAKSAIRPGQRLALPR